MANLEQMYPLMDVNDVKFRTLPENNYRHGSSPTLGGRRNCGTYCKDNLLLILTVLGVVLGVILGFVLRLVNPTTDTIMLISFPGEILMRMLKMLIVPLVVCSLVSGVVLGVILGFVLRLVNPTTDTIMLISFPGEILMRMLKMLIVPLVVCSLVSGLASLDAKNSGKMGMRALCYYLTTSFVAVILGIVLVLSIHPGDPDTKTETKKLKDDQPQLSSLDTMLDLLRNIFPDNILQACFQQTKTVFVVDEPKEYIIEPKNTTSGDLVEALNSTDLSTTTIATVVSTVESNNTNKTVVVVKETVTKWVRTKQMSNGVNVLGIIAFFTTFGILVSNMGHHAKPIVDFFNILNEIITRMVNLAMWYSPLGIMSLIMGKILEVDSPDKLGTLLGMYMITVLVGLAIHMFIILPGIYFVIVRRNPYRITWGLMQAFFTVVGTASSTATLPVTFRCLEEKLGMDRRVTRFVLPIGATINMDGTALYEAVAPIFIAQLNGIPLSFGNIVAISLTATCASIGAAAIPSAGLVTMVMVLTSVGLPIDDISLILTVDWFLDRFRTITNIFGDSIGAGIVEHLSQKELKYDNHMKAAGLDEFDEDGKSPSDA